MGHPSAAASAHSSIRTLALVLWGRFLLAGMHLRPISSSRFGNAPVGACWDSFFAPPPNCRNRSAPLRLSCPVCHILSSPIVLLTSGTGPPYIFPSFVLLFLLAALPFLPTLVIDRLFSSVVLKPQASGTGSSAIMSAFKLVRAPLSRSQCSAARHRPRAPLSTRPPLPARSRGRVQASSSPPSSTLACVTVTRAHRSTLARVIGIRVHCSPAAVAHINVDTSSTRITLAVARVAHDAREREHLCPPSPPAPVAPRLSAQPLEPRPRHPHALPSSARIDACIAAADRAIPSFGHSGQPLDREEGGG
ncbi:hypothetical protein B0H16DRAFT_921797 [Mycena metata]|uniref:Uncharacterized protein n=1 Tax=Mycena metata TaxID=1033252 RepID=A0AAD7IPP5_9AGAR|nr:hypothetical protein B0H16DRAFT_921797 [Mycena metata]